MKAPFHRTPDGQSGLFFTAFGAFVVWQSLKYPLGRASQMGPGYFPLILGSLLVLVGLVVLAKAVLGQGEAMPTFEWRAIALITVAIVASALLLLTAGLLVAVPVLVIVSSLAATELRWRTTLGTAVVLTLMAWLIFVVGLYMRIPLIWS